MLDGLGTRTFTLTIHELANPHVPGPNSYTRRLVIDDDQRVGALLALRRRGRAGRLPPLGS